MVVDKSGKPLQLKADLGAFKLIQEMTGKNPFSDELTKSVDPVTLSAMLYAFALRGGSDVTVEYIDDLPIDSIVAMQDQIGQVMGDSMPEKKQGKVKARG